LLDPDASSRFEIKGHDILLVCGGIKQDDRPMAQRAEHFHHRGVTSENEARIYA